MVVFYNECQRFSISVVRDLIALHCQVCTNVYLKLVDSYLAITPHYVYTLLATGFHYLQCFSNASKTIQLSSPSETALFKSAQILVSSDSGISVFFEAII